MSATLGEPEAGTRATAQGSADATGAWVLQFLDAEGKRPIAIQPNWLVHVSAPNGSADIRPVKLSLIIDPAQTRVSGEGPPDSRLEIFSSFSSGAQVLHTNAQGRFSALWRADRMPGIDAWAEVFYEVAPNQKVFYRDRYASLVIELDSAIVRITAPPMSHVSASVEEADRRLLATVTGTANGWGEAMFGLVNQVTGKPLPIRPGLRVIATSSSEEYSHQIDPVPEMTGRIVPGGRSLIGRTESIAYNAVLTARLYWPPDPDSPCTATMVERRGTVDRQGNYVILFETGGAGALPQPLALLERLVLAYTRRTGEEAQRELSPEWNLPAAHLYMPIARKDLRPR